MPLPVLTQLYSELQSKFNALAIKNKQKDTLLKACTVNYKKKFDVQQNAIVRLLKQQVKYQRTDELPQPACANSFEESSNQNYTEDSLFVEYKQLNETLNSNDTL